MRITFFCLLVFLLSCKQKEAPHASSPNESEMPAELDGLYTVPVKELKYSKSVNDTFNIFSSLPRGYSKDSAKVYPVVILLDANAYFEAIVSQAKLTTLTQDFPPSIFIGIGYKNFMRMDSLRDRDYTFPKAEPKDSFLTSGGGDKFKAFIDDELIPQVASRYKIDPHKITLMGHSLGGYFVLYHMLSSRNSTSFKINRYVAASPSLHYYDGYLLIEQQKLPAIPYPADVKLFVSTGSLEHDASEKQNHFTDFKKQIESSHPELHATFVELGSFDHMEAAIPGFMKGLGFVSSR